MVIGQQTVHRYLGRDVQSIGRTYLVAGQSIDHGLILPIGNR